MNPIYVIPVHSTIDLITNSSSELFICHHDKSLSVFKKVLKAKWVDFLKTIEPTEYKTDDLFSYIFKSPTISKFNVSIENYTNKAELLSVIDYNVKHPVFNECEEKANMFQELNNRHNIYLPNNKLNHQYNALMRPWENLDLKVRTDYYIWCFNQNNLPAPSIEDLSNAITSYYGSTTFTKKISDLFTKIYHALSYHYFYNKGDIILESASDNSVPYKFNKVIEDTFNAKRIHTG